MLKMAFDIQGRLPSVSEDRPGKKQDCSKPAESPLENFSETVLQPRLGSYDNLQPKAAKTRMRVSVQSSSDLDLLYCQVERREERVGGEGERFPPFTDLHLCKLGGKLVKIQQVDML